MGDDTAYQSPLFGLVGRENAARQKKITRSRGTDLAGKDLTVMGIGDSPKEFGRAKGRTIACHRHITEHRDHQAPALRYPVYRRNDGLT